MTGLESGTRRTTATPTKGTKLVTRVKTTFNDDVIEVDSSELLELERRGFIVEQLDDQPAESEGAKTPELAPPAKTEKAPEQAPQKGGEPS